MRGVRPRTDCDGSGPSAARAAEQPSGEEGECNDQ
jgi:hypothetical protein